MEAATIYGLARRYKKSASILVGAISIAAAYSLFYVGYFSRTPPSHITIMGAWSTGGALLELSAKLLLSALLGRIFFSLVYGTVRNTSILRRFAEIITGDLNASRAFGLYSQRFLRRNATFGSVVLGLVFLLFATNGFYGLIGGISIAATLISAPVIMYPLFFRPEYLNFSRPYLLFPRRPSGTSNDRWLAYTLSYTSMIAGIFFFFSGQAFFYARASRYQTLYSEAGPVVGSIIAANNNGVLFLTGNSEADGLREREHVFYSYGDIRKISNLQPRTD